MQIKDIPAYVTVLPSSLFCDIDGCDNDPEYEYHYSNSLTDPDAFQVWSLCFEHSEELEKRIAQSEEK